MALLEVVIAVVALSIIQVFVYRAGYMMGRADTLKEVKKGEN